MKRVSKILYRRKPFVAIVFALAMAVLAIPITTQAGNNFHFRGNSTDAFFRSFDSSGCIETDVSVFSTDDNRVQNPPGPANASSSASMFISQINLCTGTQLLAADCFASLAEQDFQVTKKLDSATLIATLGCFDVFSNFSFNVDVDLDWAGTGDQTRTINNFHSLSPGCTVNFHSNGTSRPAEASGTVSDGKTNFTPNTSDFADIASVQSGQVDIGCPIPTPSPTP